MPKEQVLVITPPSEICFKGPYTKIVTEQFSLSNPTDQHIAFKVKTTAPKRYCVRPNNGFIAPKKTVVVSVMLQPQNKDEILSEKNKHKFMIQSVISPTESGSVEEIFKAAGSGEVMDSKFRCVFDDSASESKIEFSHASSVTAIPEEPKPSLNEPKDLGKASMKTDSAVLSDARPSDGDETLKGLVNENKLLRNQVKALEITREKLQSGNITGSIPVLAQPQSNFNWILILIISFIALFAGVIIGKSFH